MSTISEVLYKLQQDIKDINEDDIIEEYKQRLSIEQVGELFNCDFYGDSYEEAYELLLEILSQPEVSPHIHSITLSGPDEGANGTNNWNIEPLFENNAIFSNLKKFSVKQNCITDHNRTIIGEMYDEEGVLAKLLSKAPKLKELVAPSAPNDDFFKQGVKEIQVLSIDAGYDTQNFITNLAKSDCFPDLTTFEWGEYNETYMDDYAESCTPFEDYKSLFTSKAFKSVKKFVWKHPNCSDSEIEKLKELTPNIEFVIVREESQ